eukprot:TRINITY_DN4261_c0_g1_i2.p1 TRINITY_DN4261_c0_g1~~TRINITY_DN4261_c0_g1_i2.p1  ORF type:complete len:591 (+),score=132.37 TRINITY_DN4261_c0_g1_i2:84-1856(+)
MASNPFGGQIRVTAAVSDDQLQSSDCEAAIFRPISAPLRPGERMRERPGERGLARHGRARGGAPYSSDTSQKVIDWLEQEVTTRLQSLDKKMDELVAQMSRQHQVSDHVRPQRPLLSPGSRDRLEALSVLAHSPAAQKAWPEVPSPPASPRCQRLLAMAAADDVTDVTPMRSSSKDVKESSSSLRMKVFNFLEDPDSSTAAAVWNVAMPAFIMLTVVLAILQTSFSPPLEGEWEAIVQSGIDGVFFLEFCVRIMVAPQWGPVLGNLQTWLDFLAAAPLFLRVIAGFSVPHEERFEAPYTYVIHMAPLCRTMKVLRFFKEFKLLLNSAIDVYIQTLPCLMFVTLLSMFFALVMYLVEPRDNIDSYPKAIYFVFVTMSTVGYGDISPTTGPGYVVCTLLVSGSCLVMAMPLGIIGQAIAEVWRDRDRIIFAGWARERLSQMGYTAADIPKLFKEFDPDGNGHLDFDEFCDMVVDMRLGLARNRIAQLFQFFDEDGGGTIDCDEFIAKVFPTSSLEMKKPVSVQAAGDAATDASDTPRRSLTASPRPRSSGSSRHSFSSPTNTRSKSPSKRNSLSPAKPTVDEPELVDIDRLD